MKKKYKKILAALIVVICLAVFGISLFKPVTAKMEVVRYGNLEKSFTVPGRVDACSQYDIKRPGSRECVGCPF